MLFQGSDAGMLIVHLLYFFSFFSAPPFSRRREPKEAIKTTTTVTPTSTSETAARIPAVVTPTSIPSPCPYKVVTLSVRNLEAHYVTTMEARGEKGARMTIGRIPLGSWIPVRAAARKVGESFNNGVCVCQPFIQLMGRVCKVILNDGCHTFASMFLTSSNFILVFFPLCQAHSGTHRMSQQHTCVST